MAPPNPKIKKACEAMKLFGIPESKVRSVLKKLLKIYDGNWIFIEDDKYKVLLDEILDEDAEKKKKGEKKESKRVATNREKRKAPEQSKALVIYKEDDESEEDETPLKKRLRRKPSRLGDYNGTSSSRSSMSKKAKEEDTKRMHELPPLKRYLLRTSLSMETKMIPENTSAPPVLEMGKSKMSKNSDASALMILNDVPFTVHKPMIRENSSALVLEKEKSKTLANVISNIKDITFGEEKVMIPWKNEINDEVPSILCYIPKSVLFQDAAVRFPLSNISDEQCCFSSCIGECLVSSSSAPCNCTSAYTVDGLLKDDFLEERISEARYEHKQVLHFCKECPIEKAKKEDTLEPCKGHIQRKGIKECWIKCRCTMRCGNRVVQRGIHNKLEVFYTANGKGWGVRTLEKLRKGEFVCDYIGEILTISELYQRSCKDKLTSSVILDAFWGCSEESLEENKALCLDGTRYGNISRFLNHRCLNANLIEIPVHIETPDQHYYHLAFFTTRDIEAMEELTWDYGFDLDDDDSLMKPFGCLCGSRYCRNLKRSKKAKKVIMN